MDPNILKIVYTKDFVPHNVHFTFLEYIRAFIALIKVRSKFKNGKTLAAINYIESIVKNKERKFTDIENADVKVYNARRVIRIINKVFPFLRKNTLCLEYSISLCAALVSLGFDLDLIIGKALNYTNNFSFHAWLEIDGVTINYRISYFERFTVVYRGSF